jgi:hypothetical protein
MGLHPAFPESPYEPLVPSQRWFPANETLRATEFEERWTGAYIFGNDTMTLVRVSVG